MKKKAVSLVLSTVLCTSLLIPGSGLADDDEDDHRYHPWENPAQSTLTLKPGTFREAGMRKQPIEQIDGLLNEAIEENVMPGAVSFVARSGHIVKHEAYGYAARYKDDEFTEMERPVKMSEETIFDLASISKIFTTTAAMILYEEGKFQLDDPVAKHIPEFATNGKESVTIEQLMTHTSGFKPWVPLYTVEGNREDRLQYVFHHPLSSEPGSDYTYSDLNMITLGALVEKLSGKRLDEFVEQEITRPLNMTNTMYNPPQSLKERIAATEYQPWTNRGLVWGSVHDENAWSLEGVAGHAGVFSTASDLAVFAHMFLREGKYGDTKILEKETVKLLTENRIPQFPGDEHGLGWELQQGWFMDGLTDTMTLGHTGYTGTSIVVSPSNQTIAILLTNRVHPTRNTVSTSPTRREFARQVADAIPVRVSSDDDDDFEGYEDDDDENEGTWFAGYGDNVTEQLTASVDVEEDTLLEFANWYQIEDGSDFGTIQISENGEDWTEVKRFTGSSEGWTTEKVELPEDTRFVRFTYDTDRSVNWRGWYVSHVELDDDDITFNSEDWEKRSY